MDEKEAGRVARETHKRAQDAGKEADEADGEPMEKKSKTERTNVGVLDLSLVKTDPNKLYPVMYHAIKVRGSFGGRLTPHRMSLRSGKNGWRRDQVRDYDCGQADDFQTRSNARCRASSPQRRKLRLRRTSSPCSSNSAQGSVTTSILLKRRTCQQMSCATSPR